MSRILSRTAVALAAILTLAPLAAFAQSPTGRWLTQEKFAPNPNPEEDSGNPPASASDTGGVAAPVIPPK